MMKRIACSLIVLLLLACEPIAEHNQPRHTAKAELRGTLPTAKARTEERNKLIEEELDYYMKRHHVDEEGYDMVARYREQGDSLLLAFMPQKPFATAGMLKLRGVARQGTGVAHLADGSIVLGQWRADTLVSGVCIDSVMTYSGQFDRYSQPHGHGSYLHADGTYYEGHLEHGLRQGFGFAVSPHHLQAGVWKDDRFMGERIIHNSDRIYGIDISRYQHEQGRKRFGIDWGRMRIGHLGRKAGSESVDFPVSFAYIKATEGISIRNKYFAPDYAAAHKRNIHVGAYHFFSTKQSGRLQANFFLSQGIFRRGDLPPMLDIEPTDWLISKMGGPEALFREIRAWLTVVEKRTGTRPLLYVNQRFVKKYLPLAPDLKEKYQIWIARYSEYKPGVHLAIWQLTAEGRVNGIRGAVDINVFNGYAGQWEEFLRQEAIP